MNALLGILQCCRWLTLAAIFLIALLAPKPVSQGISRNEPVNDANLKTFTPLAIIEMDSATATIVNDTPSENSLNSQQQTIVTTVTQPEKVPQVSSAQKTQLRPDTRLLAQHNSNKDRVVTKTTADQSIVGEPFDGNLETVSENSSVKQSSIASLSTASPQQYNPYNNQKAAEPTFSEDPQMPVLPANSVAQSQTEINACAHQLAIPYTNQMADEAQFLVTQLFYADMLLSNEMFAYQNNGRIYLPLEFIVEQLLLPLQIDIATLSVHGWFVDESKTIQIDQQLMLFWNQGYDCSVTSSVIYHDSWDLYIETKILQQLFGIDINFDSARQKFEIAASENIPLSQLIERQKKYQLFNAQKNSADERTVRAVNKEYAVVGDLALNVDLGVRTQSFNGDAKTELDSYIQARTDLFGHNSYAAYSQTDSGATFNGYLERVVQDQWINFYRLGDVDSHSLSLVSSSTRGAGFTVSAGTKFTADLRTIVVDGELEPGWDVELYRNNTLVGVQRVQSDGLYRFIEVPYYIGLNQYQLRFYGPNGESRVESFSKLLDSSVLEKGSIGVNVGGISREQDDLKQYYADINWAAREDMTLGLALVQQQDEFKQWQFLPRLSVNYVGDAQLIQLNYVQSEQGYATSAAIQGSQSDIDWQAEWQKYSNYSTWDNVGGRIKQEAFTSLSGSFADLGLNWGLNARWQALNFGSDNAQANFLLSGQLYSLSLSNELRWSSLNKLDSWSDRIAISGRLNDWQVRSYVDVEISPELTLNQWVSNLNTAINDNANYQVELRYQPNSDTEFSIRNSIAYFFDFGSLRLDVDNASNGDWFAQMKWNSALLWDTEQDRWLIDRMSYINTGTVKIIAFQDDNANGEFEAEEQPISGLRFSGHSQSNKQTDQNGELLVTQLQTNRQQKLTLNENSLADPFLLPAAHIISVNPHPGHIQPILFPVMYTAEVEGEVVWQQSGLAATGKLLELQSSNSDKTYQARVEYDGIFIFDQILPGDYQLFLDSEPIRSVKLMPGEFLQLPQLALAD
ncbi:carboxypeptidase regulatory-like domain-containing protein [Shewanella pneumatophori]|uniref:Carboxypeptidase regulatory-like domain-containing protein n=1 Tax=Shewanella pneumatophori TaxID=314092 RepID=A0A9X1ZK18_9GAMM|nr:carboxypeptidase regulatory-like domain-containing protein [Shewanella pneumatophori]MCL1137466.1 carboxypeptidase regulatory-like domain-containing protein [Shewanella pneumatophori]